MSVKVKLIDEQHQYFMGIMNEFYGVLNEAAPLEETMRHIIGELVGYAIFHFSTEEKYFDLYDYELKDEHVALHRAYKDKIDELQAAFENGGGAGVASDLLNFMEQWWANHVSVEDKKYSKCFNEHGLNGA